MSLSVGEKLKVVQALDALGVHFIEAGFPSSNPKEAELFERLAELELEQRDDRRLRDDPAPRPRRPRTTRRCATLVDCFAPVVCLVGKTWGLHLEKVIRVSPRGEPGDDRRLGRLLPRAGQARRLRRRALLRRLPRRRRLRARVRCAPPPRPAPRTSPSATPTAAACPRFVAEATARRRRRRSATRSRSASTPTTTPSARSPTRSPRSRRAPGWCRARVNGYGERCGNANLASILPALQLKMGFEVVGDEQLASLTATAHYLDELCNMTADPDQPYVGRNAFAHKARDARRRGRRRRPHLRAPRPGRGRQRARHPRLRALGQGDDPHPGRAGRPRARRRGGGARGRAAQGARAPRLPLRGGAGLLRAAAARARPAATSRCSSSRASG